MLNTAEFLLARKVSGGGGGTPITYTLTADTTHKTIVLTPSEGSAQSIIVPYATDASTINGHDVPELENGKIPAVYLPSYVDDVIEYTSRSDFPSEGESRKIYIDLTTNKVYRWSGSTYAEISESLALGETSATAYRGDRGKTAYDHSQATGNPHGTTLADLVEDSTHRTVTDTEKLTWSGKQDALTFDNTPTENSTNPVKSGGVYTALAGKANASDVDAIENDLYETITIELDKTIVYGYYADGVFYSSEKKLGRKADVTGCNSVILSGKVAKYYDFYDFLDVNSNVISHLRNNSAAQTIDMTVDVPQNAKYVVMQTSGESDASNFSIKGTKKQAKTESLSEDVSYIENQLDKLIINNPFTVTISENDISIKQSYNGGTTTLSCIKEDNNNGVFSFKSYAGAYAKGCNDDICPVNLNGGFKGAGHGDSSGIKIVSASHGKTIADIGSKYKGENNITVTIIKIVDENTLLCIGEPKANILNPDFTGARFAATAPTVSLTHVSGSGGTNTDTISIDSAANLQQIYPSINHHLQKYYVDRVEVTQDGTYSCNEFIVYEEYNLIDAYEMYLALTQNVGNNTNTSYYDESIKAELVYIVEYRFTNDCTYVTTSLVPIRSNISDMYYGAVQAINAGNTTMIPYSDYKTPAAQNADINVDPEDWDNANFPPMKFYQINNSDAFVLGYDVTFGDGMAEYRKTVCDKAYKSSNSTKKMYPYFIHGINPAQYNTISARAYRRPVRYTNNVLSFICDYGDYYVLELDVTTEKSGKIELPSIMNGKRCEVIASSNNMHILSDYVVNNGINYITSGVGSATIKIF